MPVYSMSTFVRCAVVPIEGSPILFEPRTRRTVAPDRGRRSAQHAWEFYDDPAAEAPRCGHPKPPEPCESLVCPVGLPLTAWARRGPLRFETPGSRWWHSAPITQDAREVKTPDEIGLFEAGGAVVSEMLGEFEAAVVPGIRERDLLAVLSGAALRPGAEYLATGTCASGPNTNPWRAEANRPGRRAWGPRVPWTPTRWGSKAISSASPGRSCAATAPPAGTKIDTHGRRQSGCDAEDHRRAGEPQPAPSDRRTAPRAYCRTGPVSQRTR